MFIGLITMGMVTVVSDHRDCDEYFAVMHQALSTIMQRVYGDIQAHDQTFIKSRHIQPWNENLAELAEGRWIDTIFSISALMTISTQLSYARSTNSLCREHGIPFLKLVEAASSNIAANLVRDAQVHLDSIWIKALKDASKESQCEELFSNEEKERSSVVLNSRREKEKDLTGIAYRSMKKKTNNSKPSEMKTRNQQLLEEYLSVMDKARETVQLHISIHSVEMVFSQFPLHKLIEKQWLTKERV
jgi:hypothetical protein